MATDGPGKAPGHSTRFYAAVSIAAALPTVGLKAAAYLLTGSVGLLSDAAESSANLIAAVGAFCTLRKAWRAWWRESGRETPLPIEKDIFTNCTGTTCLSLLLQMRTEGRCLLLAGEVAVG